MSVSLDPIQIIPPQIAASMNKVPIKVNLPISALRISGIRINNLSAVTLKIIGMPGVNDVWLGPYTEDWFPNINQASTQGNFFLVPWSLENLYQFFLQNTVLITIYEVGDPPPQGLPTVHQQAVVSATPQQPNGTFWGNSAEFASAAAGNVQFSVPNDVYGNQLWTCLSYLEADFGSTPSGTVAIQMTLTGVGTTTLHWHITTSTTTGTQIGRTFPNPLVSGAIGFPASNLTLAVPAVAGGPAYSLTIMGFGSYTIPFT